VTDAGPSHLGEILKTSRTHSRSPALAVGALRQQFSSGAVGHLCAAAGVALHQYGSPLSLKPSGANPGLNNPPRLRFAAFQFARTMGALKMMGVLFT